ncbi:MAG: hypothetical protein DHS20C11_18760 [Lysobacteraceae bacterium]|nr:MAG: hypothetical protein DHS20C11_18760 [Xanthomonadaceae bacterium]
MNTTLALTLLATMMTQSGSDTEANEDALKAKLEGERERATEIRDDNERLESRIEELEAQLAELREAEEAQDVAESDQQPDGAEPTDA